MGLKEDYNLPDGIITLGKMKPSTLITTLFYTGLIGVIYFAYQFGKYISLTNTVMKEVMIEQGMYTVAPTNNSTLGFFAGVMCFLAFLIIWKVVCEFLLLIFNALSVYVKRRSVNP